MNRQDRLAMRMQRTNRQGQQRALAGGNIRAQRGAEARPDFKPLQYREEYGFRMTDEQYGEYTTKVTDWQNQMGQATEQLNAAQGEINTVQGKLDAEMAAKEKEIAAAQQRLDDAAKVTLADSWSKYQSSFVPVRIVDASGNNIEATYRIPKEGIAELTEKLGPAFVSNWVDNGANFNISVRTKDGAIRGDELHNAMNTISSEMESSFYEQNLPNYAAQKQQIAEGYDQLNAARAELISSYQSQVGELNQAKSGIQSQLGAIENEQKAFTQENQARAAEYEDKRDLRRALFT